MLSSRQIDISPSWIAEVWIQALCDVLIQAGVVQINVLSRSNEFLAMDSRGHGKSDILKENLTARKLAKTST